MRVAILSAIEPLAGDILVSRGFVRIGGRSILQLQLDLALALDCERIVCLSNDLPSELIQLQHDSENAGAQFQCIRNARLLSKMVGASDEVLLLGDGVVVEPDIAFEALSNGRAVLTFPAREGVAAGFERIDRDMTWAGALLVAGTLIERLAELPSDIDVQSSLLRLSLQAGTPSISLDKSLISEDEWVIVEDESDSQALASRWLRNSTSVVSPFAPVSALANLTGIAVLKRHSEPKRASIAGRVLSGALIGISGVCAYFGQPLAGLATVLAASFAEAFGETIAHAIARRGTTSRASVLWSRFHPVLIDIAVIVLVAASVPQTRLTDGLFAIFVTIGLLRVIDGSSETNPPISTVALVTDRGTLAVVCMAALLASKMIQGIQLFALILLSVTLWQTYRSKLTPT